jgi:hypothetical protein
MKKLLKQKKLRTILPTFLLLLSPLYGETNNTADPSMVVANEKGISLIKNDPETTQNISLTPDENNITMQFKYTKDHSYSFNIVSDTGVNQDNVDTVLNIAFKALYTGAKMGTYIGIKKSSTMKKFIISQGFKLKNGKIKLSTALVRKLSELNLENAEFPDKVRLNQKRVGAEYTYDFF